MYAAGSDSPFTWNYLDGSDLKSSLTYPNGLTASWAYDTNGQLLQVKNAFPTNTISQYDYTYDAAGHRVQIARSGSAMSENRTDVYGYNARSELVLGAKLGGPASVPAVTEYAYQYDDIGNRLTSLDLGTNRTYAANNLNQYTLVGRGDPTAPQEEFEPQFDDDGNQTLIKTATGIWSVTYNGENRPILWTCIQSDNPSITNNQTISMSYDRKGRRVTKNDQRFIYDGYLQIANFEHQTSNIKLQMFIWDPTEPVATRPLVWTMNDIQSYYTTDGSKNVSELVSSSDLSVVTHYEYAPFGKTIVEVGACSMVNPWRFSSEYFDCQFGLESYNFRQYDNTYGRWYGYDPLPYIDNNECMRFCNNDPIRNTDVLGMIPLLFKTKDLTPGKPETVKDVQGVDDIFVDGKVKVDRALGRFRYEYEVKKCEVIVWLSIKLDYRLDEKAHDDAIYYIVPHAILGNGRDGRSGVVGDKHWYPKDAVLAHEKGHARGYLEYAMSSIVGLLKAVSCLRESDIELIKGTLESLRARANEPGNRYANEDELAWFLEKGFTRKDGNENGKEKILLEKAK